VNLTMKLDSIDQSLLNIIQSEFPLSREPFADLGKRLNIRDTEVIKRTETLKNAGIIRMISPVVNPRKLGYQTTLVCMKIREDQLEKTVRIIATHPMVSHCYMRDHDLNFWFTLALSIKDELDNEVQKLGEIFKADTIMNLPAIRVFKIGAYFKFGNSTNQITNSSQEFHHEEKHYLNLSLTDRKIINELQQDLTLNLNPYDIMSNNLSMDKDDFLNHSKSLIQRGIMRRYSASVNHYGIGLLANSMTCWQVPLETIEKAGRKIARFGEVSHCYQRRTSSLWPHNLYAMIHADTRETCQTLALQISQEAMIDHCNPVMLFSTKEIKKTRIYYHA